MTKVWCLYIVLRMLQWPQLQFVCGVFFTVCTCVYVFPVFTGGGGVCDSLNIKFGPNDVELGLN